MPRLHAACALSQGQREDQEDAVVIAFPAEANFGFVVLADGMGGHAAGDEASSIVVDEVHEVLTRAAEDTANDGRDIVATMRQAASQANRAVRAAIRRNRALRGMGSTLLITAFHREDLFWLSIGDSPLFLWRDNGLRQINVDHSMAPQIDLMAAQGLIDPALAREHPDRNSLRSAVTGSEIPMIDCPVAPLKLRQGDIVIAASDGLQSLSNDRIRSVLSGLGAAAAEKIVVGLMQELTDLADPEQDNTALAVVRVD